MGKSNADKDKLMDSIRLAIQDVSTQKEIAKIKSLSRHDPEKVAKILYLFAVGVSQTQMVKKHKIDRETIIHTLVDYSDFKNKFRELGGKLAARNYINMSSLTEDVISQIRQRIDSGSIEVGMKDLKDLSIAMANSSREALTARGEATQISEDRVVYTQEDYEQTKKAALDRIKQIKKAEIIEDGISN